MQRSMQVKVVVVVITSGSLYAPRKVVNGETVEPVVVVTTRRFLGFGRH